MIAKVATAEQMAEVVLKIFAKFHRGEGGVLRANNFVAVAANNHLSTSDIKNGIEFAKNAHWIETTSDGSWRLTAKGFEAMPASDSHL